MQYLWFGCDFINSIFHLFRDSNFQLKCFRFTFFCFLFVVFAVVRRPFVGFPIRSKRNRWNAHLQNNKKKNVSFVEKTSNENVKHKNRLHQIFVFASSLKKELKFTFFICEIHLVYCFFFLRNIFFYFSPVL